MFRAPRPSLRPFVETFWSLDEGPVDPGLPRREHVLPTGRMHLVIRLSGEPLRLFDDDDDRVGRVVGTAVIGGARAGYYVRETGRRLCSVGAQLLPGAAFALFGARADELAGRHTALGEVWGAEVERLRTRLAEARSHAARLDLFEAVLAARLPAVRGLHPAVAQALDDLRAARPVHDVVRRTGYSHRALVALFSGAVGLTPKRYARVRRFGRALHRVAGGAGTWSALATDLGYADQAHFTRDFRDFTGVTPSHYRALAPRYPHHLPVAPAD